MTSQLQLARCTSSCATFFITRPVSIRQNNIIILFLTPTSLILSPILSLNSSFPSVDSKILKWQALWWSHENKLITKISLFLLLCGHTNNITEADARSNNNCISFIIFNTWKHFSHKVIHLLSCVSWYKLSIYLLRIHYITLLIYNKRKKGDKSIIIIHFNQWELHFVVKRWCTTHHVKRKVQVISKFEESCKMNTNKREVRE